MADLDDALFALDGVLDFTAALSDRELQVTVRSEMGKVEAAARQALSALPAVKAAGLVVSVKVQSDPLGTTGKRKLAKVWIGRYSELSEHAWQNNNPFNQLEWTTPVAPTLYGQSSPPGCVVFPFHP
jgi:hypothetical protein